MRRSNLLTALVCLAINILSAQTFPPDPVEGTCYIRCAKEFRKETVDHVITPAHKKYWVVKATYRTVEELVVVKPASVKYEYVPAVYRQVIDSILVEEPVSKITLVPIKFIDTFDVVQTKPAYSQFELRPALANCKSKIPGDCDVICYVKHEAETVKIPVKKVIANPNVLREKQKGRYKVLKRQVIVTPATVREIEIPAETITLRKQVLVKDETLDSTNVGAITKEVVNFVRDPKDSGVGAEYEWVPIDCSYLDYNILPIYYDFNSAMLTAAAKAIIDDKVFKLMNQKENSRIRIEISSHTDSRASDDFNLDLSERRAKAVVDYLASKGVERWRLEYHGYGETQLINGCSNGVECSEEEHAKNRRTEFRVLPR